MPVQDVEIVKVKNLSKSFKLPHEQHSGIKQLIINIFNRKGGYETQHVLDDISFDIKKGEAWLLGAHISALLSASTPLP